MRNSLQDQLLKSGLVSDKKLKEAHREKKKEKKQAGKGAVLVDEAAELAKAALQEKALRDRELAELQKTEAKAREHAAQVKQLIEHYKQPRGGDIAYNFSDGGVIKKLLVSAKLRDQIIRGHLVIVRVGEGYELVPVAAAERIKLRCPDVIVLWNIPGADEPAEDDPYKDFPIPDDLMW